MKYILMCGSNHEKINGLPRQMVDIHGERNIDRTIRLLRENGVKDIAITATDKIFQTCNAEYIEYDSYGDWVNCFYPDGNEPVCYIFGDVVFSDAAIRTIVNTETDDIQFFASAPPFDERYPKKWAEPFAYKVVDRQRFRECVEKVKQYKRLGKFYRDPIAWELWQVIKNTPLNMIIYDNYVAINDYTCDIDCGEDVRLINTPSWGVF
jgi:NDP-sugar pyrophosphorylase family protein